MSDDRLTLRTTFERVADVYGSRRPPLPPGLFDELVALTGLTPGGRVLEVGCGPGRATVPMARRGYEIVAVELGEALAEAARRSLAGFTGATVVTADFEQWEPQSAPFDVVMSVDAWHWLDADVRTRKSAELLRPGGAIAVVRGVHVAGGDTDFFNEMQRCYEQHMPGTPKGLRASEPQDVSEEAWGLDRAAAFDQPVFRRWVTETEYTTETYLELISTFSGHIALSPANREALFACLTELLETGYGGRIRRATLTELCVARRNRSAS